MQKHKLGHPAVPNEILELPVEGLLRFFLSDQSMAFIVPGTVK